MTEVFSLRIVKVTNRLIGPHWQVGRFVCVDSSVRDWGPQHDSFEPVETPAEATFFPSRDAAARAAAHSDDFDTPGSWIGGVELEVVRWVLTP